MKKNYCDYCGEECSPTPEFKVPDIGINEVRAINKKMELVFLHLKLSPYVAKRLMFVMNVKRKW